MHRALSLFLLTLALGLVGCAENTRGRVSAQHAGDLIDPPPLRIDPVSPLLEACGAPMDHELPRAPYVQQLRPDGAHILWVSDNERAETVQLTRALDDVGTFESQPMETTQLSSGVQRRAAVDGLEPATVYCYSIMDGSEMVYGPVGFRTAPSVGDVRRVDVLAFGDSGDGMSDQLMLAEQMSTVRADVIIHMGDLVYPSGAMDGVEAFVFDVYGDLFRSIPFYPTFGNHDLGTASGAPYFEVFDLPTHEDGPPERYYSFDYGHVHFVSLDSNGMNVEQADWFEEDLRRNDQPWTIVYAHKNPFSSGFHGGSATYRSRFLPAIRAYGVQLVLGGHDHHYERIQPDDGVTYVVTGAGGRSTRLVSASGDSVFAEPVTHLTSIHIEDDELLLYAIDATGKVFDSARVSQ